MERPAGGLKRESSEPKIEMSPDNGLPPGPRLPGAVQTLKWMYRPIDFMEQCRDRYGRIFSLRLGPASNVFVIADPAAHGKLISEAFRAALPRRRHQRISGTSSGTTRSWSWTAPSTCITAASCFRWSDGTPIAIAS